MLKITYAWQGYIIQDNDLPECHKEALPKGNSASEPIQNNVIQKAIIDEY